MFPPSTACIPESYVQVVNLNNTTLLGDAAMDQNAEPKALGNDRAQARANQEIETAAAQDAAFTAKQHYI